MKPTKTSECRILEASTIVKRLALAVVLAAAPLFSLSTPARSAEIDECAKDVSNERIAEYEIVGSQRVADDYVVLIGKAKDADGTLYGFVKNAGAWRTYRLARKADEVGSFFDPGSRRVVLWTMWASEGPGASFDGVAFDSEGKPQFCTSAVFPAELNKPSWAAEYLTMENFNVDADGVASIVGEASIDRTGVEEKRTYTYRSKDGGRTWDTPKRVKKADVLIGTYQKFSDSGTEGDEEDLKRSSEQPLSRAPACSAPGIGSINRAIFETKFKSRYCKGRSKSGCAALWANFGVLLDLTRSDIRVKDVPTASYLFATAFVESYVNDFRADTLERKGKVNEDKKYWIPDPQTEQAYYGRGWTQVTWKEKYAFVGKKLQKDLLTNPDIALEAGVSYEILLRSMQEGWLETYRKNASGGAGTVPILLGDFVSASSANYASARSVINANCKGRCNQNDRVKVGDKGYIPTPEHLDAGKEAEMEALFFEGAICEALTSIAFGKRTGTEVV